jgi:GT2 family glycosyltransferase
MFNEQTSNDIHGPSCDVSIVVPNWNGGEVLAECVDSILEHTHDVTYELILVDNGSTDESRKAVVAYAENEPRINSILNDQNLYFARACNQGFAASCGRYVLIANNDILLRDDSISQLLSYADEHPEVAVVTPQFVGRDGHPQEFVRRLPNALYVLAHYHRIGRMVDRFIFGRFLQRLYFYRDRNWKQPEEVEQAGASFSLFRRDTIEKLGCFFDEAFPLLFNDVDIYRRLSDQGFSSHVVPSIRVIHLGGISSQKLGTARYRDHQDHALFRYFRKHHRLQYCFLAMAWPVRWHRATTRKQLRGKIVV